MCLILISLKCLINLAMENEPNGDSRKSRVWTLIEEENLMNILQELVVEGQKQPNGKFKSGAHETAAQRMKARMEGIDITFKHVANKLKRWNTKYTAVCDMINTSGFGWDDTKKCVIVDNQEVLQQYLAVCVYDLSI